MSEREKGKKKNERGGQTENDGEQIANDDAKSFSWFLAAVTPPLHALPLRPDSQEPRTLPSSAARRNEFMRRRRRRRQRRRRGTGALGILKLVDGAAE